MPISSAVCDRVLQSRSEGGAAPETVPLTIISAGELADASSVAIYGFISGLLLQQIFKGFQIFCKTKP